MKTIKDIYRDKERHEIVTESDEQKEERTVGASPLNADIKKTIENPGNAITQVSDTPQADPFSYERITGTVTDPNLLVRLYNNVWSIPSQTRMSRDSNGSLVITGPHIAFQSEFLEFLNSLSWRSFQFPYDPLGTLAAMEQNGHAQVFSSPGVESSWDDIMYSTNYKGSFQMMNGALCYVYKKLTQSEIDKLNSAHPAEKK